MIVVNVKKQSNHVVNVRRLKEKLANYFKSNGIVSDAEVSVAIVAESKMRQMAQRYLKENSANTHNVLSFTYDEVPGFVYPPDGKLYLGEIAICYKKVLEEAQKEGKLIQEKVDELALHGAEHLLGIHHN